MSSIYNDYFLSNKIKVFPCAYRNSTYDATARLNTEYNFIHLPHTVDKASYIIKFNDIPENETTTKLICVIQGYYFEIELGDGDYATLQNKYLNICVASPNSAGSIESPHLCSWESINIEDTLDITQGSYTFFAGLKISSGEALSKDTYKCYALKLGASAKLPIMANKIENSAGTGKPISQEFTTEILSATTIISTPDLRVASDKLTVNSGKITAKVPVTINNTLEVKTSDTSILKAEDTKVTINKPTNITGTTTINGATQIENSSSGATNGNLKVAGTGNFGGKLTVNGKPTGPNDAVRKLELDNTLWLSGGILIQSGANLNTLTTVGNYYYPSDATHIVHVPLGTYGPFTLKVSKVSSVPDGSEFLIQQQFTQCNNGNTYTRVRKYDGSWESIGSALGSYGSGWSATYNTITAATIEFTRKEAINSGCKESKDGTHKIIVPVKALIQCAVNHYSTRACLRVGGVGGTLETNESYYGLQIEGLPEMDDFLVHIDIKSYNSDAWITLEKTNKTYQCFYNSNYYAKTINGQPNPYYDARPLWIYVPRAGHRDTCFKYKEDADGNKTYTDVKGNTFNTMPIPIGNIGSTSVPVYLSDGQLTACGKVEAAYEADSFSSGTTVKLTGDITGESSSSTKGWTVNTTINKITRTLYVSAIEASGTITADSFNAKSDRRLKENIIDYKPEKSILDLSIKKFDFIDGPKNQIGCIAQDLKEICPEIVNENEKGYLSIQESKLVYLLLDEVKKLKSEVEKLKNK